MFKKPPIEKRKAVVAVERTWEYYLKLRSTAHDVEQLRDQKKPAETPFINIIDEAGDEHLNVELTPYEWRAIRWYLLRHRIEKLRTEGIDV